MNYVNDYFVRAINKHLSPKGNKTSMLNIEGEKLMIMSQAINASVNGIALSGLDGRIIYINSSFMKMWGYNEPEQILGRFAIDFWDNPETAQEVIDALARKGGWLGTMVGKRQNGSHFFVQLSATIVKDKTGKAQYMVGSFVDITKQKKAEQKLRRSRRSYLEIIQQGSDGMIVLKGGVFVFANRAFAEIIKYRADELVGEQFIAFVPKDERVALIKEAEERINGKPKQGYFDFNMVRKDGKIVRFEATGSIFRHDGEASGVGVLRDISNRKKTHALNSCRVCYNLSTAW